MGKHRKLTTTERLLLSQWKKEGLSNIECGKRLGRDKSTIGRELKRNWIKLKVGKYDEYVYEPEHAQAVSEKRKQNAFNAKQPLKSRDIYGYVIDHLRQGWSPEQIAGRLRHEDHPDDKSWWICHETIYRYIYSGKYIFEDRPLFEYLRRKQKRRRKRGGRKAHRLNIPDRVSIHERPEEVEKRRKPGHWEGDSLVGLGRKSGLHTEYERVSSLIRFERMKALTAREALTASEKIFSPLPDDLAKTTTWDNGLEHVSHKELTNQTGILVFFADPYSAYQRGGNENANLWIRYYFPKGTDFSKIDDEELRDVEWELNNRPRKRLQYKTPQEVFDLHLRGCISS